MQVRDDVLLEMRGISKTFGGIHALRDVSLRCRRGTVHALLGENGAGKSTLIKILAGAYQADGGTIEFAGESYTHLTTRRALALGIRIIYQELNLLPYMTVAENIFLGDEPRTGVGLVDTGAMRRQAGGAAAAAGGGDRAGHAGGRADGGGAADGGDRQGAFAKRQS